MALSPVHRFRSDWYGIQNKRSSEENAETYLDKKYGNVLGLWLGKKALFCMKMFLRTRAFFGLIIAGSSYAATGIALAHVAAPAAVTAAGTTIATKLGTAKLLINMGITASKPALTAAVGFGEATGIGAGILGVTGPALFRIHNRAKNNETNSRILQPGNAKVTLIV